EADHEYRHQGRERSGPPIPLRQCAHLCRPMRAMVIVNISMASATNAIAMAIERLRWRARTSSLCGSLTIVRRAIDPRPERRTRRRDRGSKTGTNASQAALPQDRWHDWLGPAAPAEGERR